MPLYQEGIQKLYRIQVLIFLPCRKCKNINSGTYRGNCLTHRIRIQRPYIGVRYNAKLSVFALQLLQLRCKPFKAPLKHNIVAGLLLIRNRHFFCHHATSPLSLLSLKIRLYALKKAPPRDDADKLNLRWLNWKIRVHPPNR